MEPLDDAWARRVAIDLSADWKVELCSVAIGGARASDMLTDQVDRAVDLRPGLALIAVGANDAIRATSVARFEADLADILSRVSAASDVVVTLGVGDLGTIPRLPRSLAWALTRRGRAVNDAIRRARWRILKRLRGESMGDDDRILVQRATSMGSRRISCFWRGPCHFLQGCDTDYSSRLGRLRSVTQRVAVAMNTGIWRSVFS